jgi:peptide/nickel transport system ATP-binding protein
MTYLLIAHDLAIGKYMSHPVAVMYLRKIAGLGEVDQVYIYPLHPYT